MSHVNTVKVQMTDRACLVKAAETLGLECLPGDTHKLYSGAPVKGLGFKLPDWKYPVVVNPETGEASYDNYNGGWGQQVELDRLVQRYGVEVAMLEAQRNGYMFQENVLDNGDVECTCTQLVGT